MKVTVNTRPLFSHETEEVELTAEQVAGMVEALKTIAHEVQPTDNPEYRKTKITRDGMINVARNELSKHSIRW